MKEAEMQKEAFEAEELDGKGSLINLKKSLNLF
jgi:hypothetical protein